MKMTTRKKRWMLAAALAAVCGMPAATLRADTEFGENTPYYEDDAWYDISEWFDGNDYNPTDEAIGRWDDETWDYADALTSSDSDNDWNSYADYGYQDETGSSRDARNSDSTSTASNRASSTSSANNADDDWFYDYYDDGSGFWDSKTYSYYMDSDDDGLYDAFAFYSDNDGDGFYEEYDFYSFDIDSKNQDEAKKQAQQRQKEMKSTLMKVSGKVASAKTVKVHGREHLFAHVETDKGSIPVDLGTKTSQMKLSQGDPLTATGHLLKVGEKTLFVADQAQLPSGSQEIERKGRQFQGTIEKLKTVDIRGQKHQLAKINTKEDKTLMVDLGPQGSQDLDIKQGQQVTVDGVVAKVKDRVLLLARKVTQGEKTTKIARSNS